MRTIIAGSRDVHDYDVVEDAVQGAENEGIFPSVVLSGRARGVDRAGEVWARMNGVPVDRFPADWKKHGRSAGFRRNAEMAASAEALIAVWDGHSRGTKHMINTARRLGLKVHVHLATPPKTESNDAD